MAIVTGPLHSSEARGQVGGPTGLVYNTHRGRAYVKANALPKTEYSDLQKSTRAIMVAAASEWLAIGAANRVSWEQFAHENHLCDWTGSLKRISGWNWWSKLYYATTFLELDPNLEAPSENTSYLFKDLTIECVEHYNYISWTPIYPEPPWLYWIVYWVTGPHKITEHPSIKMAHRVFYASDLDGGIVDIQEPGHWYTYYLIPTNSFGMTMPPTRLVVEVT